MASAELKEIRKALTKESIREHQLSKVGGTETDMFVCGKCKGKSCTYTQVKRHTFMSVDTCSLLYRDLSFKVCLDEQLKYLIG